ncbi:SCO1860 family LAETG-anchored protein [Streptomyces sp. NPDC059766]|uniref:SCO1860 family LAETG-anchored protein n=1 Tax=Streptomyces sp. NPDC059766 TaxID=3346940 RepID=UPI00364DCE4A
MNGNHFRMPARRLAAVAAATSLAAGPAALVAADTAHATTGQGRASAAVLRTGLDVALLHESVGVPLAVSLNEVEAPKRTNAQRTALRARLDGVDGGKPFSVLSAEVATAKATVTADRAEGSTELAHARLHVPGLPLLSVIEVDGVTSKATCEAGKTPVASANVLGAVTVLGKRTTLTAGGPTDVKVPGVGEVRLDLSKRETTSRTAAATALELTVSINPLKLNVAEVKGTVSLAQATCEAPEAAAVAEPSAPAAAADPGTSDVTTKGAPAQADLAQTGGSSVTPYLVGGAAALLVAGGGAVALSRRRG